MALHQEIQERAEFISEALQEASRLVENLSEKDREQAFPIVLHSLLDGSFGGNTSSPKVFRSAAETPHAERPAHLPPHISVNEFFQTVNPDSHVGRFICAAYYLLHVGQVEHFSLADILDIYGKLRTKKPVNPTDTLAQCIRKAHIIDGPVVNGQKSWVITHDGEKYVEGLMHGTANAKKSTN